MELIKRFDIALDKAAVYYPGQVIHGDVILDLVGNLRIKNVRALIKGKAHVKWTATKHGERRTHKQDQYFLDDRSIIFGKEPCTTPNGTNALTTVLPQGHNRIPFEFNLPNNFLPCSFESRFGNVRYFIRVILDLPFSSPPQEIKYFSVIGPPINCTDELYLSPIKLEKSRILWNMCGLKRGSFFLSTTLDRTAYCCGEFIKFKAEIHNKSHQYIVMSLQLKQHVEYRLEDSIKSVDCVVTQKKTPKISPLAKVKISSMHFGLQIPIVPPTLNDVCRLIHIDYILQFSLELDKLNQTELHLEFPIVMGTIPRSFKNAPPPILFYSYCVNHVEGGNYITPEFQTGQVYDGGLSQGNAPLNRFPSSSSENDQLSTQSLNNSSIIYKPLYLTVSNPDTTKKFVAGNNVANGDLNNAANGLDVKAYKQSKDLSNDGSKILDYF